LKLRDRDAIISAEGLIFRVYGYWHPPEGYICDPEYAPSTIFQSSDPKALRQGGEGLYYKFYADEGLNYIRNRYPQYQLYCKPFHRWVIGVPTTLIHVAKKPPVYLRALLQTKVKDILLQRLVRVVEILSERSSLRSKNLGVFGSLLHAFHHPLYSDLDFVIIGEHALKELLETLRTLYRERKTLRNEFEGSFSKHWGFVNFPYEAYARHQRRKLIYGVILGEDGGRDVKVEFEPVKSYTEARNEYGLDVEVVEEGWVKAEARIIGDREAPYMPSLYEIEVEKVLSGPPRVDPQRILSYMEEFRMQAQAGERVYVEGRLESVRRRRRVFQQITLTYGARYYEQALYVLGFK